VLVEMGVPVVEVSRVRILLVDDSEVFLDSLVDLAAAAGLDVVATASSGEEALRLFETHRPDAVVVDVELSGMSGKEVAERIRAAGPATTVVLVSARDDLPGVASKAALTVGRLRDAVGASAVHPG
jgi:two-component system invasion response regulator UvrY